MNLVPVVIWRKGQAQAPELYVRFCRAVKQCCVKGNGELVSCWNDTLKELERETYHRNRHLSGDTQSCLDSVHQACESKQLAQLHTKARGEYDYGPYHG